MLATHAMVLRGFAAIRHKATAWLVGPIRQHHVGFALVLYLASVATADQAEAFTVGRPCGSAQNGEVEVVAPSVQEVIFQVPGSTQCLCSLSSQNAIEIDARLSQLAEQVGRANESGPNTKPGGLVEKLLAFDKSTKEVGGDSTAGSGFHKLMRDLGFPTTVTPGFFVVNPPDSGATVQGSMICWSSADLLGYVQAVLKTLDPAFRK